MPDPIDELSTVDPQQTSKEELVTMLRAAGSGELGALRPEQFAKLISLASTEQIDALMAHPDLRERVVGEVFRRMGEHYQATDTEAVVHWRLKTGEEDCLRYECVLSGSTCTVREDAQHDPRVTITLTPSDFLHLVSGNASPAGLFMSGKLKVAGDFAFAVGLSKLFRIPKA